MMDDIQILIYHIDDDSRKEYNVELKNAERRVREKIFSEKNKPKKTKTERTKEAISKLMNMMKINDSVDVIEKVGHEFENPVEPSEMVALLKEKIERNDEEMVKVKEV